MKISPTDPQLTHYALNELDPSQRAAIQSELRKNPACQAEVEAIRETANLLTAALEHESCPSLTHAQAEAMLAKPERPAPRLAPWQLFGFTIGWRHGLALTGTAALVICMVYLLRADKTTNQQEMASSETHQVSPENAVVTPMSPPATPANDAPRPGRIVKTAPVPGLVPVPVPVQVTNYQARAPQPAAQDTDPALPETRPVTPQEPTLPTPVPVPVPGPQWAILSLALPAPTLKGTPEDLPTGPNIEPRSDKPRPPFMVPLGTMNLALNKKVTGSDARPFTGSYEQVTDGEKEAFDDQVVEMRRNTQWVQIDLGEPATIYAVVVWHDHRWLQVYRDVIVQVADDADFTQNVKTLYNNDMDNSSGRGIGTDKEYFESEQGRLIDAKGAKGRYVRAYSRGSNLSAINCIQEVEVYGIPDSQLNVAASVPATTAAAQVPGNEAQNVDPATATAPKVTSVPLSIVLPAPTLKGTPEDLPSGPNIEPLSDKPRPLFMTPQGTKNLALKKKVTGSARPISGNYEQVTDGEKEAFDDQVVEIRSNTQWVQIDLGEPSTIYAVAIWHDHRWLQVYRDVILQVADNADFTQNVRTLYNNDMDNSSGRGIGTDKEYFETYQGRLIDAKGVQARYVRSYSRGKNLSARNGIQEIEVYGLPDSPPNLLPNSVLVPVPISVPAPSPVAEAPANRSQATDPAPLSAPSASPEVPNIPLATAALTKYESQPGTKVLIAGTSTIHDWTVEGQIIRGSMELGFDPRNAAPGKVPANAAVVIPVRTLKSGKPVMDEIMGKAMKSQEFKNIEYKLNELEIKEASQDGVIAESRGDLTVSGVTRKINMPVTFAQAEGGKLKVVGNTTVKMTDFNVEPPSPNLPVGKIITGDEVKLTIEWMTAPTAKK